MKIVKKSWGEEKWIVNDLENGYCGKILTIRPNEGTSLHYHLQKTETFLVLGGILGLFVDNKLSIVDVGSDPITVHRKQVHKLTSLYGMKCTVLEVSTPHIEEDTIRC